MDDSGSGEVHRPVPELERPGPEVRKPTATPHPVAVDRIDDRAHRDLGEDESGEADAFRDRSDDDVAGRLHEHDLEQEERQHSDVVGVAGLQEEPVRSDHAGVAVTEDRIQRSGAADVGDRRDTAELEREPDGVIREQRQHERRQVHHHHVAGVLRSG